MNECWEITLQVEHLIKDQTLHTQNSQHTGIASNNLLISIVFEQL